MDNIEGTNGVEVEALKDNETEKQSIVDEPKAKIEEVSADEPVATPLPPQVVKVKRDFYQTEADIVVNFLAKNLKSDEVKVEYSSTTLNVEAKLSDGSNYSEVIKLFNTINPSFCSYKVLSTKIEIRLRKEAACTWTSLEAKEIEPAADSKPCYPTSSKTKKDWGKVEKEIEKEIPDSDDVNNLFSKIFASGTEETQRAMMKSMQESGGTVLSTNWDEVGKKKVEVSPPDGMEWKKWDAASDKK